MTKEKLEHYRQLYKKGAISKEEFRDLTHTYKHQNRSFLELGGKQEIPKSSTRPSEKDDLSADTIKSRGFGSVLTEIGTSLEKNLKAIEAREKQGGMSFQDFMKVLKDGIQPGDGDDMDL